MLRLWHMLVHGCAHKWKPTFSQDWRDEFGSTGTGTYCVCTKCGRRAFFNDGGPIAVWEREQRDV